MKTFKTLGLCSALAVTAMNAQGQSLAFEHQVVLRHGSECTLTDLDENGVNFRGAKTSKAGVRSVCPFTTTYHIGGTPDPADRDYHPENLKSANIFGDSPIQYSYVCVTDQLTSNYVCTKGSRISTGFSTHTLPQAGDLGQGWPYGARDLAVLVTKWENAHSIVKGYEGEYLLDFTDWSFRD